MHAYVNTVCICIGPAPLLPCVSHVSQYHLNSGWFVQYIHTYIHVTRYTQELMMITVYNIHIHNYIQYIYMHYEIYHIELIKGSYTGEKFCSHWVLSHEEKFYIYIDKNKNNFHIRINWHTTIFVVVWLSVGYLATMAFYSTLVSSTLLNGTKGYGLF